MPDDFIPVEPPRRKKSLGQHFLNSGRTINRIVDSLGPTPDLTVVEIGPGRGALTRELVDRCGRLVLVEMDDELIPFLRQNFPVAQVIHADATKVDLSLHLSPGEPAVAVGNLPYNAGGRILFNLLCGGFRFDRLVLMFQKEVADRLCSRPGERNYGAVSLLVSLLADVSPLFDVPPSRFVPPPKVMSAVVRFSPRSIEPELDFLLTDRFAAFVHGLFAQPRKTVANSMIDGLGIDRAAASALLEHASVNPTVRPNGLTPEQAVTMFRMHCQKIV